MASRSTVQWSRADLTDLLSRVPGYRDELRVVEEMDEVVKGLKSLKPKVDQLGEPRTVSNGWESEQRGECVPHCHTRTSVSDMLPWAACFTYTTAALSPERYRTAARRSRGGS